MNLGREELLSRLRDMNGHRFEELVADIWEQEGWKTAVTDGSGDGGIDVIVEKDSPFNPSQKHVIQAKCYSDKPVGGPDLRDFRGAIDLADNTDAGVFVTTSYFTSSAEETADRLSMKLNLVDGDDLCEMILDLSSQRFLSDYINVDATDGPHPKNQARVVEEAFDELLGIDIELVERMSVSTHATDLSGDEYISSNMSDCAKKVVCSGFGYFSLAEGLAEYLADYWEESSDSSNVTVEVLEKELTVAQVIAALLKSGDLERAWLEVEQMRSPSDPPAKVIMAYMFLKHSLEWDTEKEKP